jgi:hypothetical protein
MKKKSGTKKPQAKVGFGKSDSVISRRNQNGTVILMRLDKASSFYKIDGVAAEVWTCLEAPKPLEAVVEFFGKRYPQKKTLSREIDTLVKKLTKLELLAQSKGPFNDAFPALSGASKSQSEFGKVQEFDLEQIESEVLNESIYLDVFAGSDLRLKRDVAPIQGALDKVVQLDGITHRWKGKAKGRNASLIAQQVAMQMPELVRKDRDQGHLAINYQKLSSYLVEAIKDLHRLALAQEKRIKKLESRL